MCRCGITAEGVGKSACLTTLDLSYNKIGDSGPQALGAAATGILTNLSLSACEITAAGAAHSPGRCGNARRGVTS